MTFRVFFASRIAISASLNSLRGRKNPNKQEAKKDREHYLKVRAALL